MNPSMSEQIIPQDSSSLVTWQRQISSLAAWAMNALTEEIPNPPSKRITPTYLLKVGTIPIVHYLKDSPKKRPMLFLLILGLI